MPNLEEVVIGLIRIAGSLPVLRWPLAGGILALVVDFSDLFWMNILDLGGLRDYQAFDKRLDLVYMVTFLIVAWRWPNPERAIAVVLFGYRMLGALAFELSGSRTVLVAFPNVFEFWFLFVSARRYGWGRRPADDPPDDPTLVAARRRPMARALAVRWLMVLTAAKMLQEWVLHSWRELDNYVATEVVAAMWRWLLNAVGR